MNMNPYDVYKRQDLETCSKEELVAKLYNEASLSLKRAVHAIEQKKFESANEYIKKSQVIISTLNNCLDMHYDIAIQLRKLYRYMLRQLLKANASKDTAILKDVSETLSEFRDTWYEAIKRCNRMKSL